MLGVGTAEGAPVAQEKGGFLKDAQGGILVPRLESASLKDFAESLGGQYTQLQLVDADLRELGLLAAPTELRSMGRTVQLDSWADQGYWLLLPLLLLAACAGRRGWVLCLPLLMAIPQPSYAFDFEDLWRRPDQQGQHLLQRHRPAEAARHFENIQWQGIALYEAGDFAAAAQRFAQGNTAADHYNRGNALARSGELEAAIDAYEQALERQPDFAQASANKALVEQMIEQNKQAAAEDASEGKTAIEDDASKAQTGEAQQQQSDQQAKGQPSEDNSANNAPPFSGNAQAPDASPDADEPTRAPSRPVDTQINAEQRQALEQWLRQIPDEPGELLRRKFWYEQQQHQEKAK